ncbi:MAG: TlyA family RNA methyltransferase [Candidatus Babeliales bacterium]|nr:TlyA family RNA methyltransferase [Candidatus Babeliales bacterium]
MKKNNRLDQLIQEKLPDISRTQIASMIMQGKVKVDGKVNTKPGSSIKEDSEVEFNFEEPKFVSRAGFKLEKALDHFGIDVTDLVIMDAGISTGGFTHCMLQRGAKKVYGVDVGFGQVHERVTRDPRVVLLEKTNLRNLESLPEKVDLVTLDLSFISVLKVMPVVTDLMTDNAQLVVLIKPQFEAKKHQIGRGGIVKDDKVHQEVIQTITEGIKEFGFACLGVIESPIAGATGNKEFLAHFKRK